MSQESSEPASNMAQMKPYLLIALVLIAVVATVVLWPSKSANESEQASSLIEVPVVPDTSLIEDTVPEPDLYAAPEQPKALVIEPVEVPSPQELSEQAQPDPVIDESDGSVKAALIEVASSPHFAKYLVDESLIQKFVVNVNSLANRQLATNNALVKPPEQGFSIYEQADRQWIDASSFQRYNGYVEMLESVDIEQLVTLFGTYRPLVESKYAEISRPGADFTDTLIDAIDELLDTPRVPAPIEVYSESVMYKFKDPKLEALSGPQKQLIRTGPENTRRIKEVLRELKQVLEQQ